MLGSYITVDIFTPKVAVSGTDSSANITENVAVTDENVDLAIQALRSKWKEIYEKGPGSEYLEIYHTRVLTVDPDRLSNTVGKEKVKFIVEVDLYSDWYSTTPCYINKGLYNNVINYDDGTTEIVTTVVMMFLKRLKLSIFDTIVEVKDYGTAFNQSLQLT